jgi:hypothetical protein
VDRPWAQITTDFKIGNIEQGAQAVLIDPVDINLKRFVRLVHQSNLNWDPSIRKHQRDAIEQFKNIIVLESFLELAAEDKDKADFQIAVNEKGEYEGSSSTSKQFKLGSVNKETSERRNRTTLLYGKVF